MYTPVSLNIRSIINSAYVNLFSNSKQVYILGANFKLKNMRSDVLLGKFIEGSEVKVINKDLGVCTVVGVSIPYSAKVRDLMGGVHDVLIKDLRLAE